MPLGMGNGVGFVASVETKEAIQGSTGSRDGKASFLRRFEVEAVPLESSLVLFFVELPSQVFTIFKSPGKKQKEKLREKEEKKGESFLALRGK